MALEFDHWSQTLFASVTALSRTAGGATQAAYGGHKPALRITDPAALAQKTEENLRQAISHVWNIGPTVQPRIAHITAFMNAVAAKVSAGLIDGDLFRTWDTRERYPQQVAPFDILWSMADLSQKLSFNNPLCIKRAHPHRVAATLEREIDWRIHPYADGCGRTAKLLGAWVLLRHGSMPPRFDSKERYYKAMNAGEGEWLAFYSACILESA